MGALPVRLLSGCATFGDRAMVFQASAFPARQVGMPGNNMGMQVAVRVSKITGINPGSRPGTERVLRKGWFQ